MLRKHSTFLLSALSVSLFSINTQALPIQSNYMLVAPTCLTEKVDAKQYEFVSKKDSLALVKTNQTGLQKFIDAKSNHSKVCGGFLDVTDAWNNYLVKNKTHSSTAFLNQYATVTKASKKNYSIRFEQEVNDVLTKMIPEDMWNDLKVLSGFPDREANSDNGVKAANWFIDQVKQIAEKAGRTDVSISTVKTGRYQQPSVVVKLGTSNDPGIVIGGHMDTLSSFFSNRPGADDDGTGSVTVLEVARLLLSSPLHFQKPIYFIWYAAEEEGLIGSQHVVQEFKSKHIPIDAVIHLDMTGYAHNNEETMWLIDDYVNTDLTNYLSKLIETYVKKPIDHTSCGYACSDHASWTNAGVSSAIAFESKFGEDDPYIHTAQDTMEVLSLSHMTSYAKLAVAFAIELAEPVKA